MSSSGTFAKCKVEGAPEHADHQVWETCKEVFDQSLFVGKLNELRIMSYDDLEKKAILSVQEVFSTRPSSFILDRFASKLSKLKVISALHG